MDKIRILQIGEDSWKNRYAIPERVKIIFAGDEIVPKKEIYEIVVLERNITEEEFDVVDRMSMAYCLFVLETVPMDATTKRLFVQNMG